MVTAHATLQTQNKQRDHCAALKQLLQTYSSLRTGNSATLAGLAEHLHSAREPMQSICKYLSLSSLEKHGCTNKPSATLLVGKAVSFPEEELAEDCPQSRLTAYLALTHQKLT